MQIIQLSVRHLLGSTATGFNGCLQLIPGFPGICQQRIDSRQIRLIKDGGDNVGLLGGSHAIHGSVQIPKDVIEGAHIAFAIVNRKAQSLHLLCRSIRGTLERKDNISEVRTTFGTLNAVVGEDTQSSVQLCGATLDRS